jgi:hypothetical protein
MKFAIAVQLYRDTYKVNQGKPIPKKGSEEYDDVIQNKVVMGLGTKKEVQKYMPYDSKNFTNYTTFEFTIFKRAGIIPVKDANKLKKMGVWEYI